MKRYFLALSGTDGPYPCTNPVLCDFFARNTPPVMLPRIRQTQDPLCVGQIDPLIAILLRNPMIFYSPMGETVAFEDSRADFGSVSRVPRSGSVRRLRVA